LYLQIRGFLWSENAVQARFGRTALADTVNVDPEPVPQGIEDRSRAVQNDRFGPAAPVDSQIPAGQVVPGVSCDQRNQQTRHEVRFRVGRVTYQLPTVKSICGWVRVPNA